MKDSQSDKKSEENVDNLLSIIPSMKELSKAVRVMEQKEAVIYKAVLDVLEMKLKKDPLSTKYRKEFLPLCIRFYANLSIEEVFKVNRFMKEVTSSEMSKL